MNWSMSKDVQWSSLKFAHSFPAAQSFCDQQDGELLAQGCEQILQGI